jgi:uncharacterized delta-60 repeat protein
LNASLFMTWSPISPVTGYSVYYSSSPGVTTTSGTLVSTTTNQTTIAGLTNGTPYYGIVTASNATLTSTPSNQVSGTPQATGSADATFASTGMVTSGGGAGGVGANQSDLGRAAIQDSFGRIVSVGNSNDNVGAGQPHMAIWRYNLDGTPDLTFNGTGGVFPGFAAGGMVDRGNAVALDSQGRIVVAGISVDPGGLSDLAIWRYNADGTPDLSFNGTGVALTIGASRVPAGGGVNFDQPFALKIDSQGRIVVLGDSLPASADPWFALWRYLPDGTPDLSFTDGQCQTGTATAGVTGGCLTWQGTVSGDIDFGNALALDNSDNITAVGVTCANCSNPFLVVWQYLANGTPNLGFTDGACKTPPSNGSIGGCITVTGSAGGTSDTGQAVAFDSSGRIVVAGQSNTSMTIWRFNPGGTPDSTFVGGGCSVNGTGSGCIHSVGAAGGSLDQGMSLALDSTGRIVVAGTSNNGGGAPQMVIWRYDATGAPDATFGGGTGFLVAPDPGGGPSVDTNNDRMGLFLDFAGRIVVTSYGAVGGADSLAIWRYIP